MEAKATVKENTSQVNSSPLEIYLLNGEQYTCIMNDAFLHAGRALEIMVKCTEKKKTKYVFEGSGNSSSIISA